MTRHFDNRDGRTLGVQSLRDLCYVVFRHRVAALGVAFLVLAGFGAAALLLPDRYRSEAALLVKGERDLLAAGAGATVADDRPGRIDAELEIMTSGPLVARVAEEVGLVPTAADTASAQGLVERERALADARERLRVESGEDSEVIRLVYQDSDADRAQSFLENLIAGYRDRHREVHSSGNAHDVLAAQAEELAARIAEREEEVRALKLASGIESIDQERALLVARLDERERSAAEIGAEIVAARAEIEALEEAVRTVPEMTVVRPEDGVPMQTYEVLVTRLYDLRLQRLDAAAKYMPGSRTLEDLDARIASAEELLAGDATPDTPIVHGPNEARIDSQRALVKTRANLAALLARQESTAGLHAATLADLERFHEHEAEVRSATRELAIATTAYERCAASLEGVRFDQALEDGAYDGVRVVQAPTLPAEPAGPHRPLLAILGVVTALFLGTGVAFGLEAMDDSLRTPEEVESALGVRPVVSIPNVHPAFERHRIPGAPAGSEPIRWWRMSDSELRDALSLEESAWTLSGDVGRTRFLAVTGGHRGAGSTTVAAHLAESLARHGGGRVLLVDADGAHPTLSDMLGARMSKGLSDGLQAGDFGGIGTIPTPVENLHLLPVGLSALGLRHGVDPDVLLDALGPVAAEFSHVVIDLPPASDVDLLPELRERCDGLMLVLEANRSRRPAARFLFRGVSEARGGDLAVVLNKRDFPIPTWLYSRL